MRASGVLVYRPGVRETHATLETLEWLLSTVHSQVHAQVSASRKTSAACAAAVLKGSRSGVQFHVTAQIVVQSERPRADLAHERLVDVVSARHVVLEAPFPQELRVALGARE
jgi:hypothetical protein